jgi:protein-L-isoaspartate(D-aspartate) O-methyltransferase
MTPADDKRLEAARRFYAEVVAGGNERLEAAFAFVPREHFLGPGPWRAAAYAAGRMRFVTTPDRDPIHLYQNLLFALDADRQINNGEPGLHGQMLRALDPGRGETVLHIGCGTGYYTAILANMVGPSGRVIAYEIEPTLAARARACLEPWEVVTVVAASGTGAQFPHADAIYVNAGATRPEACWLNALNDGGRLVFPLSGAGTGAWGVTLKIERRGKDYPASVVTRSGFISCIGAFDEAEGRRVAEAMDAGHLFKARRLVRDDAPDETAVLTGDGWWLSSRDREP